MAAAPPTGFTGRFFTDLPTRSAYSEGAGPYRIVPTAVAIPGDRNDLALLLRYAADSDTPVTPRGAGSGMPGGNVGAGIVVDLAHFGRPLGVALQQTANVGAAVTWAALDHVARHFGFRLPPDPSSGAYCTIGGMVATNAAGARSLRAGSIRAWVRGLEVATTDGEIGWLARRDAARSHRFSTPATHRQLLERLTVEDRLARVRPRIEAAEREIRARFPTVRKNSAGYALDHYLESGDLVDLLVGSEGTLGIVTRAELRLERVPGAVGTLLVMLADLDALGPMVTELHRHAPAAIELLDHSFLELAREYTVVPLAGARAALLVDFERGSRKEVRAALTAADNAIGPLASRTLSGIAAAEREALWHLRHAVSPALAALPTTRRSLQVIEDGCVPLPALGRYLAGVHEAARASGIPVIAFGHAGDGHLHVNALVDLTEPRFEDRLSQLLEAVTTLVLSLGGTPSGEHGDGRLRAGLLERLYGPTVTGLFAEIKQSFDPAGVLNPGVIIPGGSAPLAGLKVGAGAAAIPQHIADGLRERERTGGWGASPLALVDRAS